MLFLNRKFWRGRRRGGGREGGFLLIAVLVIVVLASMVALSLLFRMRAEEAAFAASASSEQGWAAAMSGINEAFLLAKSKDPAAWQNNPAALFRQLVVDDGSDKWYFTIFCPGSPEESQTHYGLIDENRKVNLNKATAEMLQKCTALSAGQIEAITGSSPAGTNAPSMADPMAAEALLMTPSRPQLSTLGDLLKLPGFTPGVIYGEDANHNFHLDPNEDDGEAQFPPDDGDGQLFLGLQETATVYSYELDVTADGLPRVQLNSSTGTLPEAGIPEQTAIYIQAAWSNKVVFKTPADLLEAKLTNMVEGKPVVIESGVGAKELPAILDLFTTRFNKRLIGLININTASVKVLQTVPGITEGKAEAIVQARENAAPEVKQSPAWLFSEGVFSGDEFRKVLPYITTRSGQFRFNVLGCALPSGRYRVYEVVIDTAGAQPQVLYLRDITKLGLPFALPSAEETQDVQSKT